VLAKSKLEPMLTHYLQTLGARKKFAVRILDAGDKLELGRLLNQDIMDFLVDSSSDVNLDNLNPKP